MKNSNASSTLNPLLDNLADIMIEEHAAYVARERSHGARQYRKEQETLLKTVKSIGKSGDIELIFAAERSILQNERRLYGNSPSMTNSLNAALQELPVAQKLVGKVKDPQTYQAVAESYSLPKSRIGGVPRDEARQFLNSHNTRLLNLDKSRLTEVEKKIVRARRENIRTAEKAYTALQRQALGLSISDKSQERGLSR